MKKGKLFVCGEAKETKYEAVSASTFCDIHGLWKSSLEIYFRQELN